MDHERTQEKEYEQDRSVVFVLSVVLCGCTHITEFMENTEVSGREVESLAAEKEEDTVLLGGMPVGIYMETDGVLVLDTEKMTGMDGKEYIPAQGVVSSGDYITEVNHQKIEGKKQLWIWWNIWMERRSF